MVESFEKMAKVCVVSKKSVDECDTLAPECRKLGTFVRKLLVMELLTHLGLIKIKFASI